MLKFHVMGRYEASTFMLNEPYIHIAVYTPGSPEVPLMINPERIAVLQLCFHDVSNVRDKDWLRNDLKGTGIEIQPFTEEQAQQIVEFINQYKHIDNIVVNCDAGYCRSPAIAAAISKTFNGNDEVFYKQYRPNHHVYRTLLFELNQSKDSILP